MTEPKPWDRPFEIPPHVNVGDAIRAMVANCLPSREIHVADIDTQTEAHWYFGLQKDSDPWQDMDDLARLHGLELRRDNDGVITLGEAPFVAPGEIDELIARIFGEEPTSYVITCRQCEKELEDSPDLCEDCAWDIQSQLDGWEEHDDE